MENRIQTLKISIPSVLHHSNKSIFHSLNFSPIIFTNGFCEDHSYENIPEIPIKSVSSGIKFKISENVIPTKNNLFPKKAQIGC